MKGYTNAEMVKECLPPLWLTFLLYFAKVYSLQRNFKKQKLVLQQSLQNVVLAHPGPRSLQ